jgi:hypothetical protein
VTNNKNENTEVERATEMKGIIQMTYDIWWKLEKTHVD